MLQRIYDWIDDRIDITPIWRDIADHEVPEHVNPGHHFSAFVYCFGGLTFFLLSLFKFFPECSLQCITFRTLLMHTRR